LDEIGDVCILFSEIEITAEGEYTLNNKDEDIILNNNNNNNKEDDI
jgi:hypothetical protein